MTIRVGVTGAAGRMGRMLIEAIAHSGSDIRLAAAVERSGSSLVGADAGELVGGEANGVVVVDNLAAVITDIDVLIDFTMPLATLTHAALCATNGVSIVIGTTGFTPE